MDPKIDPVTGENVETPPASPAETITPEPIVDENPQGASTSLNPEEVAWNELKGGTQDRIKQILRERDDWKTRAESATYRAPQPQYQPPLTPNNPEVISAVQKLSDVGMATKDEVKKEINQSLGQLIYNFEIEKLENKYNGNDGLPKFERSEYEDFVQKHPQYQNYQPEDVYEKMYSEEILDARAKTLTGKPSVTSSLRPTKTTVREDALTPEFIEKRLQQPDGRKWYAENQQRINDALAAQQTSQ